MTKEQLIALPVWNHFEPISLEEMGAVKLMNRIDTKFLFPMNRLESLLEMAASDYRVQTIDGSPVASYDSLYYDTQRLTMYTRHHDRQLCRKKVRARIYLDSDLAFLEVKHKNNKGRTKKKRVKIPVSHFQDFKQGQEAVDFLSEQVPYPVVDLLPQLHTVFHRITLVDKDKTERLTMDMNLHFENVQSGISADLGPLIVIELKQDGACHSRMKDLLLQFRVHPFKMSKYCVGTVMTRPDVKSNRFKSKLQRIRKMIDNQNTTIQ